MTVTPENQGQPAQPAAAKPLWERLGYTDESSLEQAVYHSRNEGRRLAETLAEREQRIAAFEAQQYAAPNGRRDPVSELSTIGVPMDALQEYVQTQIQGALQPLVKTNTALHRVKSSNPDFAQFEGDWQQWLASQPDVNRRLQDALTRDPDSADLAIEGSFAQFARERRSAAPHSDPAQQRLSPDAALPAAAGSGAARGSDAAALGPSPEQLENLLNAARRGNQRAQIDLLRLRLGNQPHPELPPMT